VESEKADVRAFVEALEFVRKAVHAADPTLAPLGEIHVAVLRGRMPRKGVIGEFDYSVHGFGCRFEDADNRDIDVDFLQDGQAVFDSWRVGGFIASLPGRADPKRGDFDAACEELVAEGVLLSPRPGWFAVPEHSRRPLAEPADSC